MNSIDLIQPRHNCADPNEKYGHIYMPTSLLTVAAKLIDAGINVSLQDENIRPYDKNSDIVGINLLGAPYIPVTRDLQSRIDAIDQKTSYLIGGQVVNGLSDEQFTKLFGEKSSRGTSQDITKLFNTENELKEDKNISLIPAYELIHDSNMKEYLSREFSFFVSQGCRYACTFCAAAKGRPEEYRNIDIIEKDLSYLVKRAKKLGIEELNIYMSNLDVFQNSRMLKKFTESIITIRNEEDYNIKLRGLSTVHQYHESRKKSPELKSSLKEAGFHTVGFGIDGVGQVWKKTKKPIKDEQECIDAVIASVDDGFTPEILMVFGHEGKEDAKALEYDYLFAKEMQDTYGAIPRPHVSKAFIPGNEGWVDPQYKKQVDILMNNPELFQCIDFTALPTELTHPNREQRLSATKYFLKMCGLEKNTTQFLIPLKLGMTRGQKEKTLRMNIGKFDR